MLKNIIKKLNALMLLLIFVSFLFITLIGNNLFSTQKAYAANPSPTFSTSQANTIKNDPTKYISFHWGNSESIYLDFNLPGYGGVNHLLLFNTDGAVNFLANQNKYYSNNFCGNNSTGININAYNYFSKSNSSSAVGELPV